MNTTAFLIFCAGVLITPDSRLLLLASANDEREDNSKAKPVKEQVSPPRPSFPLLTLPSFSSFSLPALNFPYLQAFSHPNRILSSSQSSAAAERIKPTKTEYVEVTRRQTVHPVCYTAYEAKAPCLPYSQSDFHEDDYDSTDFDSVYQTNDGFNLNEVKKSDPTAKEETARSGKYLELKLRRNGAVETSTKIQGSEFFTRLPIQQQSAEYHTKTVLITKLEKYTDRRVTATLLAVNCLPVDRSIPMCQNYPNPIREAPDGELQEDDYSPTSAEIQDGESQTEVTYVENKAKYQMGVGVEPEDIDKDGLLGQE